MGVFQSATMPLLRAALSVCRSLAEEEGKPAANDPAEGVVDADKRLAQLTSAHGAKKMNLIL
jgi:hypothetical protein